VTETCPSGQRIRNPGIGIFGGTAALAIVLLLLIPPDGILSENEENYFALANRFVAGTVWPEGTAVFDSSRHRMLSDASLGGLVWLIGYTPTQIVTRLFVVAGYALVLPALFGAFALSAWDAAIVVMAMALIGQDIIGGEWLFGGYEAKVAAYILVLFALRLVLTRQRLTAATFLLVLATYFHFLVGGFWFVAAMVLRRLDRRDLRQLALGVVLYTLLVAPLVVVIAWSRLADNSATLATDVPPPDVIYSIIREPHHQSPFLSWPYFRDHWLPGYVMALPMLLSCVWLARSGAIRRFRVTACWLAGLLAYLFLVLAPKFLDRDSGVLGKFYLFRPSSLIELLWLTLALAFAISVAGRRAWLLRAGLLAVIGPWFCYVQGGRLRQELDTAAIAESQKAPIEQAVRQLTSPRDLVLIDPAVEMNWLDFERRTGRSTWVMWKFAPTNDAELITWYRRIEARQAVFDEGCGPHLSIPRPAFLLTRAAASWLTTTCGPELFRAGPWVLLQMRRP
jgi:Domain of unknown function (DUF6798)